MATKAELQEQAKSQGVDFTSKTTKAELEQLLSSDATTDTAGGQKSEPTAETDGVETVKVNENENGEATNGTTKDGSETPVENVESVPQNGADGIEVFKTTDNKIAEEADEARTKEEVAFADESNPNQKSRVNATQGHEYDQDGNPRAGGKSYGVSDDDITNFVYPTENDGKAPEDEDKETFTGRVSSVAVQPGSFLNSDTNAGEWDIEDVQAEEKALSDEENGISARVLTSTGDYVRVKFFRNNLAFGTFRTRDYSRGQAEDFLSKLKEDAGL